MAIRQRMTSFQPDNSLKPILAGLIYNGSLTRQIRLEAFTVAQRGRNYLTTSLNACIYSEMNMPCILTSSPICYSLLDFVLFH